MKKAFSSALLFLLVWSCVVVEKGEILPQYSVYSILTPEDSVINVFVGKVFEIGERFNIDSGKYIKEADVFIQSGDENRKLRFNTRTKSYRAINDGFLKYGQKYIVEVSPANGPKLRAETTIPEKPASLQIAEELEEQDFSVQVKWEDRSNERNFYKLSGETQAERLSLILPLSWENGGAIWRTNDAYNSGKIINSPLGIINGLDKVTGKLDVRISLYSMGESYFLFDRKLEEIQLRNSFTEKFESPIFFPSNIVNGLGFFGSYAKTDTIIHVK